MLLPVLPKREFLKKYMVAKSVRVSDTGVPKAWFPTMVMVYKSRYCV